jgi:anti-sigma factor RsiW
MTPDSANDAVLKAYLLGDGSPEERSRVEERYVSDGELFERLLTLEAELIDAYVEGELPPAEKASFERSMTTMARRRQRVQLVRDLTAQAAERAAGRSATGRERAWRGMLPVPFRAPIVQWGVVAAAMVLAVSAGWMAREIGRLQRQILASESARAQSEQAVEALEAEVEAARKATGTSAPATGERIVALALLPGRVRSGNSPAVVITEDIIVVRLGLAVVNTGELLSYRGELRTSRGEERWTQTGLTTSRVGSRAEVNAAIPATALTQGEFVMTLRPLSNSPLAGPADEYHFRVERR